jgi:hypothetical protein
MAKQVATMIAEAESQATGDETRAHRFVQRNSELEKRMQEPTAKCEVAALDGPPPRNRTVWGVRFSG